AQPTSAPWASSRARRRPTSAPPRRAISPWRSVSSWLRRWEFPAYSMPVGAALPMAPWRLRRLPAAFLPLPPTRLPPLKRKAALRPSCRPGRPGARGAISLASLIHRGELAAAEILHARGKPAAARDPAANLLGINVHQQLRRLATRHLMAVAGRMPRRMET